MLTGGGRGIRRGLIAGLIADDELFAAVVPVATVELDAGTVAAEFASGAERRLGDTVRIEDAGERESIAEVAGKADTTPAAGPIPIVGPTPIAGTVTTPARTVVGTADT